MEDTDGDASLGDSRLTLDPCPPVCHATPPLIASCPLATNMLMDEVQDRSSQIQGRVRLLSGRGR